jgi:hypothetical protein
MLSDEFAEWMAYDRIDPIGRKRADILAAHIVATIYNSRRAKASDKFFKIDEMLLDFDRYSEKPDAKEIMMENMKAAMGQLVEFQNRDTDDGPRIIQVKR